MCFLLPFQLSLELVDSFLEAFPLVSKLLFHIIFHLILYLFILSSQELVYLPLLLNLFFNFLYALPEIPVCLAIDLPPPSLFQLLFGLISFGNVPSQELIGLLFLFKLLLEFFLGLPLFLEPSQDLLVLLIIVMLLLFHF